MDMLSKATPSFTPTGASRSRETPFIRGRAIIHDNVTILGDSFIENYAVIDGVVRVQGDATIQN